MAGRVAPRPNRTTVGLKGQTAGGDKRLERCPNRTTVGLKGVQGGAPARTPLGSQSHHSGIERPEILGPPPPGLPSPNRTTVGLKASGGVPLPACQDGPNRTTVGLKVCQEGLTNSGHHESQSHHSGIESFEGYELIEAVDVSQSHHSGIERDAERLHPHPGLIVPIAPQWD